MKKLGILSREGGCKEGKWIINTLCCMRKYFLKHVGDFPIFFVYFSYEATASLAKPINRGTHNTSLAEFSSGMLRSSYGDLCCFSDGRYFISNFVKELLSAF